MKKNILVSTVIFLVTFCIACKNRQDTTTNLSPYCGGKIIGHSYDLVIDNYQLTIEKEKKFTTIRVPEAVFYLYVDNYRDRIKTSHIDCDFLNK